ncbi:hypothetical protein [Paenibacillus sp. FSL H7-0331]|uniref:hypothetical protein n=1 Tax=Paenibacillus sp. FSL H7-0331 TaxID=1920421 RepID=UPI00096BF889|nr:hypothetical protein [Paenibacillus sp. FSL H7-0331]OMF19161.1 hypothetical protein BK127_08445 [Paenibacillus sp. FSL H7-0331]
MKLFQMKSNPHGMDRMALFLKDHFVCIGWPGIGDLDNISTSELERRLVLAYDMTDTDITDPLDEINCFVHMMQDGDYVLVAHEQEVYLGDIGDYYYVEQHDNNDEGMCHRRGVTWLHRIPRSELNKEVQSLLNHREAITPYELAMETAGLDRWLPNHLRVAAHTGAEPNILVQSVPKVIIDNDTLEQAMSVLKEALNSDDPVRRERAAIAILQYAAQTGSGL